MTSSPVRSLEFAPSWRLALSLSSPMHLADLFAADSRRSEDFTVDAGDLLVDFSRQRIDREVLAALLSAARECGVEAALAEMLSGSPINSTERRAVGHVALRMPVGGRFVIEGVDVVPVVQDTLAKMSAFAEGIRDGRITGSTGRPISTVVNIGIGGSDLGPRLVTEALWTSRHERVDVRFVSNVDPDDIRSRLADLDPAETLFVVSSKTFTTVETLLNAHAAATWISSRLGEESVRHHIVAVSSDERAVRASGLDAGIVFPMWEWVGGRYSIGSAVGLAAMISIGPQAFREFLAGMHDLDRHVEGSPPESNAALLMALVGIWNHAVLGNATRAVIPYSSGLRLLPSYLQQLVMESNGKSIRSDGEPSGIPTSAVIWGDVGTNAQHAFMQLLHQGTAEVPVDFIGFARPRTGDDADTVRVQRILFTNMVAQAQALAFGRGHEQAHRRFAGNRPSTVIVAPELTARVLGQIVALYEHAVFYEGILLGINSFDQWGVELGKQLAFELLGGSQSSADGPNSPSESTSRLLGWFDAANQPGQH